MDVARPAARARAAPKPATPSSGEFVEAELREEHAAATRGHGDERGGGTTRVHATEHVARRAALPPRISEAEGAARVSRLQKGQPHNFAHNLEKRPLGKDGRALRRVVTPPGQRATASQKGDGAARARARTAEVRHLIVGRDPQLNLRELRALGRRSGRMPPWGSHDGRGSLLPPHCRTTA